jgi:hypothetical protein
MRYLWWTLGIVATGLITRELWLAFVTRRQRQRTVFGLAEERAKATGKPLVVVGDPSRGVVVRWFGQTYQCGRVCVDTHGCPACETQIAGRLEDVLPRMESGSAVVFVANALEHVDDIALVATNLDRISGGDLFVTHVESASLVGWFWPGTRRRILFAPPEGPDLVYRPLPWHPEAKAAPLYVVELPATRRRLGGGAVVTPTPAGVEPSTAPTAGVIDTTGWAV